MYPSFGVSQFNNKHVKPQISKHVKLCVTGLFNFMNTKDTQSELYPHARGIPCKGHIKQGISYPKQGLSDS